MNQFTLSRIKGTVKSVKFIAFDTETVINNSGEQTFLLGTVYNEQEQHIFHDRTEMCEFLLKYDAHYIRIASNLAFDFDVLFLDHPLYNRFKRITTNGMRKCCTLERNHHKSIVFWDTYNHIQWSLEKYGQLLNLPKIQHPSFLGKMPKNLQEWNELETYCMRDSEITYKFACFLQQGYNDAGTSMRMTIGQTAMNLWKARYLPCTVYDEDNKYPGIKEKIFSSYRGARTEIFKRGLYKNFKYYDINSLYPFIMLGEYPLPNSVVQDKSGNRNVLEFEGVSEVEMWTDAEIPLLPIKDDKIIFPKGAIKGIFTHAEIRKALKEGYELRNISWTAYYKRTFFPFKEYVQDLYKKRLEMNGRPEQLIYKLLLNSLYGKTAQKMIEEEIPLNPFDREDFEFKIQKHPEGKITLPEGQDKGYMTIKKQSQASFIKPILAIYTTAQARCLLYDYIQKYNAGYCDTDSIITKKEMLTGKAIGQMKLEAEIREGVFIKPKAYGYTDVKGKQVYRFKGVKKVDEAMFQKILNHEKVSYMKFSRYRESIKRGMKVNTVMQMEKLNSLEDNKRVWKLPFNPYILDETSEARTL